MKTYSDAEQLCFLVDVDAVVSPKADSSNESSRPYGSPAIDVSWGDYAKRKKLYAPVEIPRGDVQRNQRMCPPTGRKKRGCQTNKQLKKRALIKFYSVVFAQGVYGKALTYDFFRLV